MQAISKVIATEFTKPSGTTGYSANDVLNTSTTVAVQLKWLAAASKSSGSGLIVGAEVIGSVQSEVWQPKLHIYNAARATVLQDNAAFTATYAIVGTTNVLITDITLPALSAYGVVSKSRIDGLSIPYQCAIDEILYFDLQTLTAIATSGDSAKYTVKLYVIQDV